MGWTDPFSAATYTQRQQAYARALRLNSIDTPQMVVNGADAFVQATNTGEILTVKAAR